MSDAVTPAVAMHAFDESADLVERKIPGWMAFGINVLIFGVESAFIMFAIKYKWELESFLILHAVIIGLLLWWHRWCKLTYDAYLFPTFTLVFVAALGPLGALGTAYAKVVHAFFLRDRQPFDSIMGAMFPEGSSASQRLYEGLVRMDPNIEIDQGIAPLVNILAHGGNEQKQAAIVLMARHFVPPFSPVLKQALQDPDPTIRTLAATAINHAENRMNEEARELEQDLSYNNDAESALPLALHYDQRAWAALGDEAQQSVLRDKAMNYYQKYLAQHPRDVMVLKEVGRLLFRSGKIEEASAWFDEHRHLGESSAAYLSWYMETLFIQRRYDDMRELAQTHEKLLRNFNGFPTHISHTIAVWTQERAGVA